MNPLVKKLVPKVAGAFVRGPFKRLMDRRAAKGGKLVLWWRRTFGELDLERLAHDLDDGTRAAIEGRMGETEYESRFGSFIQRLNAGENPKAVAADYVRALEQSGRVRR